MMTINSITSSYDICMGISSLAILAVVGIWCWINRIERTRLREGVGRPIPNLEELQSAYKRSGLDLDPLDWTDPDVIRLMLGVWKAERDARKRATARTVPTSTPPKS